MPVELRKRKAAQPPLTTMLSIRKKRAGEDSDSRSAPTASQDGRAAPQSTSSEDAKPAANLQPRATAAKVAVGGRIELDDFGGEVQNNKGEKTTLKRLIEESKAGVVLFTYPKASTPGCTTQACLFRDAYARLTADGLSIYGLSSDSPKANTTFKERQKLPFTLLCDPDAKLISAIGLRKQPKCTQRGVFAVDKKGFVLIAEAGGPAATVERVKALVSRTKSG